MTYKKINEVIFCSVTFHQLCPRVCTFYVNGDLGPASAVATSKIAAAYAGHKTDDPIHGFDAHAARSYAVGRDDSGLGSDAR